jgi:hypothetical protein
MLESGYIRLYRSLLSWEWYTDTNTKAVFLHLILTANWEPKKWRGITIERGQRVYSAQKIAGELKMSRQMVRTAISHLIETNEITNYSTPKYSVVTIKNYDLYQQLTNETTNCQPTTNQVPTNKSTNKSTNYQPTLNPQRNAENQNSMKHNQPANQPTTESEQSQNQPQLNKERNNKGSSIYSRTFKEYAKNDIELLTALNDFAEMRKAIKKPLSTQRAAKMLLTSLDKLATDNKTKIAILNQSIFKSWQGVFPLKDNLANKQQANLNKDLTFDIDEYERATNPLHEK